MTRAFGLIVAMTLATTAAGYAQAAAQLVAQGVIAYEELDFAEAVQLLDRAVALKDELDSTALARALTYLAAAHVFRSRSEAAAATFRRLLLLDPRQRPDSLRFPPSVQRVFEQVRQATKALSATLPQRVELIPGRDSLTARIYASSFHDMAASIEREDGTAFRVLYSGPIRDSLALSWDGRSGDGAPIPPGSYRLTLVSREPDGTVRRSLLVPLDVGASSVDTLPLPPWSGSLLPERTSAAPGLAALASGALGGGLVWLLPRIAGAGADGGNGRFIVVGALGLSGLVGVAHRGLGRPLPDNIAANEAARRPWREAVARTQQENAQRRSSALLVFRAGAPVRVEGAPR